MRAVECLRGLLGLAELTGTAGGILTQSARCTEASVAVWRLCLPPGSPLCGQASRVPTSLCPGGPGSLHSTLPGAALARPSVPSVRRGCRALSPVAACLIQASWEGCSVSQSQSGREGQCLGDQREGCGVTPGTRSSVRSRMCVPCVQVGTRVISPEKATKHPSRGAALTP